MDELMKNQEFIAEIIGYSSDGSGVCRINGRGVFVKRALKGEIWRIKILKVSKTSVFGLGMELISSSPERMDPECPNFGLCGGCHLMHMSYNEELRFKLQRVNDALKRLGGIDFEITEIIQGEQTAYRNKGIYAVGHSGKNVETGFYRTRSHQLVPIKRCMIQKEQSCNMVNIVKTWIEQEGIEVYNETSGKGLIRHVFTRVREDGSEAQVCIVSTKVPGKISKLVEYLRNSVENLSSIMLCINKNPGNTVLTGELKVLWGRKEITESLCDLNFKLSPLSFFQVNTNGAQKLYNIVQNYAVSQTKENAMQRPNTILDLYCGTGTITLCLAKFADHVIGVETVQSAVANAVQNARDNGITNAEFICADAGQTAALLAERGSTPEVIVVDPPRKGLDDTVIQAIKQMAPARIVYVSCDPATLARDLAKLEPYQITHGTIVDMFPRCFHVETCVLLSHKNSQTSPPSL